jgi:hypothetical protein
MDVSTRSVPGVAWTIALAVFCIFVLFSNLGSAALFEPDEGRNAEIAREVLLLNDWAIPHYDFIPRLDKPIFFFWLVGLCYEFFGISEWSARLPSALAALACLSLTYCFARSLFGLWAGLWSPLILVASVEFFALSRIVIFDMTLTFFITLALCCFFLGHVSVGRARKRTLYLLMYPAMGAATLIKGPIGFVLPAMVIFSYLLVSKRWNVIREMEIPLGMPLFLLVAVPWYLIAELRNPGYLDHFLWKENVARFATAHFKRSEPWYYFIGVVTVGFFPWTALLPATIADLCKRPLRDDRLFLVLWIALPLLFFSLSSSKLPHYILPIYPPLAVLVGGRIAEALTNSSAKTIWIPWVPAVTFFLLAAVPSVLVLWPDLLSNRLDAYVRDYLSRPPVSLIFALQLAPFLALLALSERWWGKQEFLYPATAFCYALFVFSSLATTTKISSIRSSKHLAEKAAPLIYDDDQLVLYGRHPSSLPFYLNIQRPIWVVRSENRRKVLGSDYVAKKRPQPAAGYGKVLYTPEEFAALWKSSKRRLVLFVDSGRGDRLPGLDGVQPRTLLQIDDMSLVANR